MWITGGDLRVADACAFEPRPARIVAKRFVSSALGACETPARPPGGRRLAGGDSENWRGHGVLNDVWNDGGVAGLAVVAYRPEDEILRTERAGVRVRGAASGEFRAAAVSRTRRLPRTHPFRWRYLLFVGRPCCGRLAGIRRGRGSGVYARVLLFRLAAARRRRREKEKKA